MEHHQEYTSCNAFPILQAAIQPFHQHRNVCQYPYARRDIEACRCLARVHVYAHEQYSLTPRLRGGQRLTKLSSGEMCPELKKGGPHNHVAIGGDQHSMAASLVEPAKLCHMSHWVLYIKQLSFTVRPGHQDMCSQARRLQRQFCSDICPYASQLLYLSAATPGDNNKNC